MKRLFILILIPFFTLAAAQVSPNRFDEKSESAFEPITNNDSNGPRTENGSENDGPQPGPGNPGAPVPINQYVAVLIITALGIIIYTSQKKKKLLSSTKGE